MSDHDHFDKKRRDILKRFVGSAIMAATAGSYATVAAAKAERGTELGLKIKDGGELRLRYEGDDRWRALVVDQGRKMEKATGLLVLADGKVVGLKDGLLRLGRFGASNVDFFEFIEFLEFEEFASVKDPLGMTSQAVLPRQLEDLRSMRAIEVGPRIKLDVGELRA